MLPFPLKIHILWKILKILLHHSVTVGPLLSLSALILFLFGKSLRFRCPCRASIIRITLFKFACSQFMKSWLVKTKVLWTTQPCKGATALCCVAIRGWTFPPDQPSPDFSCLERPLVSWQFIVKGMVVVPVVVGFIYLACLWWQWIVSGGYMGAGGMMLGKVCGRVLGRHVASLFIQSLRCDPVLTSTEPATLTLLLCKV